MQNQNTRRGFTQNVVICPPCEESVAVATKEGQNLKKTLGPLLPHLTVVLPSQRREMNSAFTLIELLVVVLIIGILAAVAVPQYQKAVIKSRAIKALTMGKALAQAEEAYYLANGEYTDKLEDLDITVNLPPEYSLNMRAKDSAKIQFNCTITDFYHQIVFILNQASGAPGTIYCFAPSYASKQSIDLCKSWGGKDLTQGEDPHYRYTIQ